jgi:hypothetical protein
MVQPCRITSQFTLDPDKNRVVKKRLTHDMSFRMTRDKISVNGQIDMTAYDTETVPLANHATRRPHGSDGGKERVPRRPLLSDKELEVEGTPSTR